MIRAEIVLKRLYHVAEDLHPHWARLVSKAVGLSDKNALANKVRAVFS